MVKVTWVGRLVGVMSHTQGLRTHESLRNVSHLYSLISTGYIWPVTYYSWVMEIFTRSTLEPNSIIIGMTVLRFESTIVKLINDKVYRVYCRSNSILRGRTLYHFGILIPGWVCTTVNLSVTDCENCWAKPTCKTLYFYESYIGLTTVGASQLENCSFYLAGSYLGFTFPRRA